MTLLQGDCLELMKDIPDKSIDLIIIDPPYKCISGGSNSGKGRPTGILSKNDGKIFKYNDITAKQYFGELYRVLKDDTHCYIMTNNLNIEEFLATAREVGFQLHNIVIWKKNNATPNRWYMKNCEYILFFRKGKAKKINNPGTKQVLEIDNIIGNKVHPTEKPVRLMEILVENSSNEGDLVLDCFMGSGSTGVACKNTNREFIGMELDENYFKVACERLGA
jgi:DNA modification methylase